MSVLEAKHLAKSYKGRNVIVDVSLAVEAGEVVGLLGPNGAGKTTCFYMIAGIVKPNGGQVFINGSEITRLPMHKRAKAGLGYLPQEASVFRKLTVTENIHAILETRKDLSKAERKQKLNQLLEEFCFGRPDPCRRWLKNRFEQQKGKRSVFRSTLHTVKNTLSLIA